LLKIREISSKLLKHEQIEICYILTLL